MQDLDADFVVRQFVQRAFDGFDRTLNVGLDDDRQVFGFARFNLVEHLFHRRFGALDQLGVAFFLNAVVGDFLGLRFAFHHVEVVAGGRGALQTDDFDRSGRSGFENLVSVFVEHGADVSPFLAGNDDVADFQGAFLYQQSGNRTAAFFHFGLDDGTAGLAGRIGFEVKNFRLQQDRFHQFVNVDPLFGGNFGAKAFAAHFLNRDAVL